MLGIWDKKRSGWETQEKFGSVEPGQQRKRTVVMARGARARSVGTPMN